MGLKIIWATDKVRAKTKTKATHLTIQLKMKQKKSSFNFDTLQENTGDVTFPS